MNYIDGSDHTGAMHLSQNNSKPKRRSVFAEQRSSLLETDIQEVSSQDGGDKFNVDNLRIFQDDHNLQPHKSHFQYRQKKYHELLDAIEAKEGGLAKFAQSYKTRGIYIDEEGNQRYKEWAPGAKEVYLTGDFCDWDRKKHALTRDGFGNWELVLPANTIPHNTKVKVHILDANDVWVDRIPIYIQSTVQHGNSHFDGIYWNPPQPYKFKNQRPEKIGAPKVYETHIGMSGIEPKVHSFNYFRENVLPRVHKLGYNSIQIMAIAEHPYYGSFGYHVSLPFAISSRFGTPDEFKQLVDAAHGLGIHILVDIVHSHASSNFDDGINKWDGTDSMYFHDGEKGYNKQWDSKLYNYGNWETIRMLLSNLQYFVEDYQVDGFRFDGITSMLYVHHGIGVGFTGNYDEYFKEQVDVESVIYLMLANKLIHEHNPNSITIAEDVSGYPTLCRKIEHGGVGFDFRLQMAVPDKWIKLLKEVQDDQWNMGDLIHTLTNRRHLEPCIVYAESHDQALVGDKTIAMWLFDKQIYTNMSRLSEQTPVIYRGQALHKMIRLITLTLGGEGYLNFMGNEFGHPEWIDFPREGNGWSHEHCRRRWDICDDKLLRYQYLYKFDRYMNRLEHQYKILVSQHQYISEKHEDDKVIVYEKGDLVFAFNFHTSKSFENYKIGVYGNNDYIIVLDTDQTKFGGLGRLKPGHKQPFPILQEAYKDRPFSINIYLPCRTAIAFAPYSKDGQYKINEQDEEDEEEQN